MPFDIEAAKKAGVSEKEMIDYLASKVGFDVAAAQKAGVTEAQVLPYLANHPKLGQPQDKSLWGEFKTGLSESIPGLMYQKGYSGTGKVSSATEPESLSSTLARSAGTMAGDLPLMAAGFALGGGPLTGGAGAFALPAAMHKIYSDKLNKGEVKDFGDFAQRYSETVKETGKAYGLGLATGGTGKILPKGLKTIGELSVLTVGQAGMEGRAPTLKEWESNLAMLIGLKTAPKIVEALKKGKAKGIPPEELLKNLDKTYPVNEDVTPEKIVKHIETIVSSSATPSDLKEHYSFLGTLPEEGKAAKKKPPSKTGDKPAIFAQSSKIPLQTGGLPPEQIYAGLLKRAAETVSPKTVSEGKTLAPADTPVDLTETIPGEQLSFKYPQRDYTKVTPTEITSAFRLNEPSDLELRINRLHDAVDTFRQLTPGVQSAITFLKEVGKIKNEVKKTKGNLKAEKATTKKIDVLVDKFEKMIGEETQPKKMSAEAVIAKKLGVRYDGQMPGTDLHSFTDLDTKGSFSMKGKVTAKGLKEAVEKKRAEFKGSSTAEVPGETPKKEVPSTPEEIWAQRKKKISEAIVNKTAEPEMTPEEKSAGEALGHLLTDAEVKAQAEGLMEGVPTKPKAGPTFYSGLAFLEPDVIKAVEKLKESWEWSKKWSVDLRRTFLPTVTELGKKSGLTLRSTIGQIHRFQEQKMHAYRDTHKILEQLSHEDKVNFMDNANEGKPQINKAMDALAKQMFLETQEALKPIQRLAPGILPQLKDSYFGRIWKPASKEVMAKIQQAKSLGGKAAFLKSQVLDSIKEGESYGFELVSDNPVDIHLLKLMEIKKLATALEYFDGLDKSGLAQVFVNPERKELVRGLEAKGVKFTTKIPAGYRDLANRAYTGKWVDGERVGRYMFPSDVADVVDNYLSKGLRDMETLGPVYDKYMQAGSTLIQMKLAGLFHAGTISFEGYGINSSVAINNLFRILSGKDSDIRNFTNAVGRLYKAPFNYAKTGKKITEAWLKEGKADDSSIGFTVSMLEKVGAQMRYADEFRTKWTGSAIKSFKNQQYLTGLTKSPFAVAELITKPIMDSYVPWVKMGAFHDLLHEWVRTHPGATPEALLDASNELYNHIERTMGEVTYDRLFMKKTALNTVQGLLMAPGWTGGNILTLYKIPKDTVTFVREWHKTGKLPEQLPASVAYGLGMALTIGTVNALMTKMLTGSNPDGLDFLMFRDGGVDTYGRPTRMVLPTLMRDAYAYLGPAGKVIWQGDYKSIPAELVSGVSTSAIHKGNPLLSSITEAVTGVNWRNEEIPLKETVVKALIPLSVTQMISGVERLKKGEAQLSTVVLPVVGIVPASKGYTDTAAEELAKKIALTHYSKAVIEERTKKLREAKREVNSYVRKNVDVPEELLNRLAELGGAKAHLVSKTAFSTPLQISFNALSVPEALRVMKRASKDEKETLAPMLAQKIEKALKRGESFSDAEIDEVFNYVNEGLAQ